jgi:hypothetical protein
MWDTYQGDHMRSSLRKAAMIRYATRFGLLFFAAFTLWAAGQPAAFEQGITGSFGIGFTTFLVGLTLVLPRQGLVVQRTRTRVTARK